MAKSKPSEFNPLNASHYDAIKRVLGEKEGLPAAMERAEQHGCNCQSAKEGYEYAKAGLEKILKEYFPKGRPNA